MNIKDKNIDSKIIIFIANNTKDLSKEKYEKLNKRNSRRKSKDNVDYTSFSFSFLKERFEEETKVNYSDDGFKKRLVSLANQGIIKRMKLSPKKGNTSRRTNYGIPYGINAFRKIVKLCYDEGALNELTNTHYFKERSYIYIPELLKDFIGFDITKELNEYDMKYVGEKRISLYLKMKTIEKRKIIRKRRKLIQNIPIYSNELTEESRKKKDFTANHYFNEILYGTPSFLRILVENPIKNKKRFSKTLIHLKKKFGSNNIAILDYFMMAFSLSDFGIANTNDESYSLLNLSNFIEGVQQLKNRGCK